jgi:hypothetical protein
MIKVGPSSSLFFFHDIHSKTSAVQLFYSSALIELCISHKEKLRTPVIRSYTKVGIGVMQNAKRNKRAREERRCRKIYPIVTIVPL